MNYNLQIFLPRLFKDSNILFVLIQSAFLKCDAILYETWYCLHFWKKSSNWSFNFQSNRSKWNAIHIRLKSNKFDYGLFWTQRLIRPPAGIKPDTIIANHTSSSILLLDLIRNSSKKFTILRFTLAPIPYQDRHRKQATTFRALVKEKFNCPSLSGPLSVQPAIRRA